MHVNIHGEPIDFKALVAKAPEYRAIVGMPQQKRKPTIPKGYAAAPGTGPEGKTCRDCKHKHTMSNTGAKSWIKCDLMRAAWTHGPGSDIRAGSPACRRFEPKVVRMNVRPGDLAIIVAPYVERGVGRVVEVLRHAPLGDHGKFTVTGFAWWCRGDIRSESAEWTEAPIADSCLRRVSGLRVADDARDESAAWLPPLPTSQPQEVTE